MADYTITYKDSQSPENRGWTSFHSFIPDGLVKLRNRMFSIKNGQLHLHNSEDVPRNNFYGEQFTSKVSLAMNQAPSENKVLKAISQEGTSAWDATVRSFESDQEEYRETTLDANLFQEREGQWFTHLRGAESTGTTEGSRAVYGLGTISNAVGAEVYIAGYNTLPNTLMIGDQIYKDGDLLLGVVVTREINSGELQIGIDDSGGGDLGLVSPGDFIYNKKDLRVDGSKMRGYIFKIDLENDATTRKELFAVNGEVFRSYK